MKRKWLQKEKEDARRGLIESQNERGWILRRNYYWVVLVVMCGYCGEEGTAEGTNYVRLDSVYVMHCRRYSAKKDWLNK